MRLRLPGGLLTTASARVIAAVMAEAGGGPIELTNRANLQLRGVPALAVDRVRAELVSAMVVPPDAGAEERRNVIASPTAGVDADELVDTRPLVALIANRLASDASANLSPKFGVLVDGGGAVHVRRRRQDLALGAVRDRDDSIAYEVVIDGALPTERAASADVRVVVADDAPALVDAFLTMCAPWGRAATLVEELGADEVWDRLANDFGVSIETRSGGEIARPLGSSRTTLGIGDQARPGRVWVGFAPPLGRLEAPILTALADLADRFSCGDVRVTPWRGVLFADVGAADVAAVVAAGERLGLSCDPTDPAGLVVACAGSRGCAAGLTDAQADAGALVDLLRHRPGTREPVSFHVSGCTKGCAQPAGADVSLVAEGDGVYGVFTGLGHGTETFGERVGAGLGPATAVALALELSEPARVEQPR